MRYFEPSLRAEEKQAGDPRSGSARGEGRGERGEGGRERGDGSSLTWFVDSGLEI